MKRILATLLVLCPHLLAAQPPPAELEELLSSASAEAQQERHEQALELAGRAEQLAAAADRQSDLVRARLLIGRAHQGLGDPTAALAAYRSSLKLAREIGEPRWIADNLLAIGEIHFRDGRLPAAAETLRRARVTAAEIDEVDAGGENRRRQRDIERTLAETHAAMGDYRQAYDAFRRYQELAAEAAAARSAEALAELEARLESDRRDTELEIAELRRSTARQRQTLGSRNRLLAGLAVAVGIALLLLVAGFFHLRRLSRRSARALAAKDLEIRGAAAELEQKTAELERTATELDRTAAELDGTAAELVATGDQLGQKSAELDRLSGLLDETAAALEQKSNALDDEAAALGRTSAELEEFRQRYRRDVSELEIRRAATDERSDEMERFVSTVSQHLKILLVTVRGALASLEEEAATGDVAELRGEVERTRVSVGEVVRLLDRLLQLLLAGRMVHASEEVSLSELAFEAVGQVADLVADKSAGIVIAPDIPPVIGDRAQLLEVLRQLLENGGKFIGDQPAPRLDVGWRRDGPRDAGPRDAGPRSAEEQGDAEEQGAEETVFYVGDNGMGIEPRDHRRVFALFEQLDPERQGDGIGLALVERIVEAHGGRVWIESAGAGRGTRVCFTLPRGA